MLKTFSVLLVGIISISFAAIFVRFCSDVPSLMIATYRLTIASIILAVIYRLRGHTFGRLNKKDFLLSMLSGVILSIHFVSWFASIKMTSVASSVVLVTTNPIFVGIFSWFILKEKQSPALIAGIVLSFLGSAILAVGDGGLHNLVLTDKTALIGDGLALLGAIAASGYLILGSKVRENVDLLTYITIAYGFSAVVLIVTSLLTQTPFTGYNPSSYIFMILLAVVPQLLGHTSFNWALKHLKASMVAISILGEPIGASILAYFIFEEQLGIFQLAGMILIFAAIITASRRGAKES